MSDVVFEHLARRLLKCPFDQEIFDSANSALSFRLHLADAHGAEICELSRITRQHSVDSDDRPRKLYCCLHCDFAVPESEDAYRVLHRHITDAHPNPRGPAIISLRTCEDEDVIDRFVEQQGTTEVCVCRNTSCNQRFADKSRVAEHWVERHNEEVVTVEEARRAVEASPETFRAALAECLAEVVEEELRRRLSIQEPDDGYSIHHSPDVPRVRSVTGESIIYVASESVSQLDREINELFEYEGLDRDDEGPLDQYQTVRVELRFSNIEDGYIPLVKDVRRILPPLIVDGDFVEICWQDEPESWFRCKVSRSKRAIYNLDGRLKKVFEPLPSGVWLYIIRVETRRYKIDLKRQPHVVPNCKIFVADGLDGWNVLRRDEPVEWETSDHVFKHHLTLQQMDALYDEAQRTGLSIKDAVYEVMKRSAQTEAVHVRDVYEAVFRRMRTCSLAAVWAQFRPEHKCYERVQPGYYRFDPTKPRPPTIHVISTRVRRPDALRPAPPQTGRYVVRQRHTWRFNVFESRFEDYRREEDACLEVRCAFGTPDEMTFVIPIRWLREHVLCRACCHEGGRYMFSVNPHDFVFRWDYDVEMLGEPFLDRL